MTALQIAKVSFELKSETPKECLNRINDKLSTVDTPLDIGPTGRLFIHTTGATNNFTTQFKSAVKTFRKGEVPSKDILFPVRMGNISYINTIPTSTHLTIIFRHDSVVANNYSGNSRSSAKDHFQPPFYFFVKVAISNGEKNYGIVNSPYNVQQRMFPHNERSSERITSHCCDGAYGDQLYTALKEDNLGVFLSVFNTYITHGTQRDDEYGRSCRHFTEDYTPQNNEYTINNLLEAKLFAYSISDPEVPFKYNMSQQRLTVKFNSHPIQKMFFSTVATLSDKITAEEVIT